MASHCRDGGGRRSVAVQIKGKGTAIDTNHTHTHNVVLTFAKSISAAATASKSGRTVAFIFSNAAQVKWRGREKRVRA